MLSTFLSYATTTAINLSTILSKSALSVVLCVLDKGVVKTGRIMHFTTVTAVEGYRVVPGIKNLFIYVRNKYKVYKEDR